jgi:PIN domain nuclease of toxin-antitoxin system
LLLPLDTHVLIWALSAAPALRPVAGRLEDSSNELFLSAASVMEIYTKYRLGKLPRGDAVVGGLDEYLRRLSVTEVPITRAHARLAGSLPSSHGDPFDRFIAAQAIVEGLTLVSRDAAFPGLGVRSIW